MDPTRLMSVSDCRYTDGLGARIGDVRTRNIANGQSADGEVDSMFQQVLPGIQNVNLNLLKPKDRYLQSIVGQIMDSSIIRQTTKCLDKKPGKKRLELAQLGLLILSPRDRAHIESPFVHSDFLFSSCMSTLLYLYLCVATSNNQYQLCIMDLFSWLQKG